MGSPHERAKQDSCSRFVRLRNMIALLCLVIWAARAILVAFKIEDPIRTLVWVVVVIFAVLIVLGYIGAPLPNLHLR